MSIMDIINPWGAVSGLKREIESLRDDLVYLSNERNRFRDTSQSASKQCNSLTSENVTLRTRTQMQKEEIMRLSEIIAKITQPRDPQSGRFLSKAKEP